MSVEQLVWESDATGLAGHIRSGDLSAGEAVDASIAMIERVNGDLNAVAEPMFQQARERAADPVKGAPFAGVPMALKDVGIGVAGVPIHTGSRIPPYLADANSTVVERYLKAGFIPVATTTSPEHGLRLVTESQAFGITRNPWNTAHTTGGSSGGSAALVAAGAVPVAHATDGGGSIRVPPACCGLVGLKPSRGRVPLTPEAIDLWNGLVVQHVVTRSVRDCAAILDLTHGADPLSPYDAPAPRGSFTQAAARGPEKLTLGVYRGSPLGLDISPETLSALDQAVALARDAGHAVEEIDLPIDGRAFMTDFAHVICGAVAGLMRLESTRTGRNVLPLIERPTRTIARFGNVLSGGACNEAQLRLQMQSVALLRQTNAYDAVLMPVIAHPPLKTGAMDSTGIDDILEEVLDRLHATRLLHVPSLFDKLVDQSFWFTHWPAIQNVTGQPAIALPVHVTDDGLPLGIQAVGRCGEEETLLSLAAQMETRSGWLERRAPLGKPAA